MHARGTLLGKRQEGKRDALDKKPNIRYFYKYGMLPVKTTLSPQVRRKSAASLPQVRPCLLLPPSVKQKV
jgi:hypothetical protein